jgi:hypothetical protein
MLIFKPDTTGQKSGDTVVFLGLAVGQEFVEITTDCGTNTYQTFKYKDGCLCEYLNYPKEYLSTLIVRFPSYKTNITVDDAVASMVAVGTAYHLADTIETNIALYADTLVMQSSVICERKNYMNTMKILKNIQNDELIFIADDDIAVYGKLISANTSESAKLAFVMNLSIECITL